MTTEISISNSVRQKCSRKLYECTKKSKIPKPFHIAKEIEKGIYNYMLNQNDNNKTRALKIYRDKIVSIYYNLEHTKSFVKRLKIGAIMPQDIPYMSPQEIAPEVWMPLISRRNRENELIETTKGAIITTTEECGRCHHNEHETHESQTRGVDEGTTQFYKCTNCGNEWKQ